jgi:hypothetical protein
MSSKKTLTYHRYSLASTSLFGTYLDDAFNANTGLGQYADNVLAALLGLVGDAAFNQVAFGVCGDLA